MLALGLQLIGEAAVAALRYERHRILSGELWRVVSGHFVHTGWPHVSLNVLGLLIIGLGFPVSQGDRPIRYATHLFLLTCGISGALWYVSPAVHWYVGLSGILHGLLVMAVIGDWKRHRSLSMAVLAILGAKLTWEHVRDVAPVTSIVIGAPVIGIAHTYGALAGLLIAFGYGLGARWARRD
jgi:rhomboid family GlyGly-CTERM serine protease